jgi:hypothetical protein
VATVGVDDMVDILLDIPFGPVLDLIGDNRRERTLPIWAITSYQDIYNGPGALIPTENLEFNDMNVKKLKDETQHVVESHWSAGSWSGTVARGKINRQKNNFSHIYFFACINYPSVFPTLTA